jgi:hypothetical protein
MKTNNTNSTCLCGCHWPPVPDGHEKCKECAGQHCVHNDHPEYNYVQWHEWAELMTKRGNVQVKCEVCGLYRIWVRAEKEVANV